MMKNQGKSEQMQRKKVGTKKIMLMIIGGIVVLVILAVFVLVPLFVSSDTGRQMILAKADSATGGKMGMTSLSMGWFKGIKIGGFSFRNVSGQTIVEVKQIATKPHYASLLTGSYSFGKTVIDEPNVEINIKKQPPGPVQTPSPVSGQMVLPVKQIDLVVNNGSVKVTSDTGSVQLAQINTKVDLRPPGQNTRFDANMVVADEGKPSKIEVSGQLTPPSSGWRLQGTTGQLTVEVNELDLGSLAPVFELASGNVQAKGLITININAAIKDGIPEDVDMMIRGSDLNITADALKGDRIKTSRLDIAAKLKSEENLVNIEKFDVKTDWLDAEANGFVPKDFKSMEEFTKPDSPLSLKGSFDCDLAALLTQMPKTVGLKEGTKIISGRLTGNIETVSRDGQRKIDASAAVGQLSGMVDGKMVAFSEPLRAVAEISADKDGMKYDKVDVSSAFCKINLSGTAEQVRYDANIDLAKLQSELGQFINLGKYQMAGEVTGIGQVAVAGNKITADGSTQIQNLKLSSNAATASEPKATIDFSVVVDHDKNVVEIPSVKTVAAFGQITVKDTVIPLSDKASETLSLNASAKIDLGAIVPFAVLFASFPGRTQLSGMAESDISVTMQKDAYHIVTDSTKITNFRIASPGQAPFEQSQILLTADAAVNPDSKTIVVKKISLVSPQIKVQGNMQQEVQADKTSLQGRFDMEYDWAAVSAVASAFMPAGLQLEGKRKDTIDFSSSYPTARPDQFLANLNTTAKIGFDKAEYMGLHIGETNVDIQVKNGLLTIAPFTSTVNSGQLNFAANVDFKDKPTFLKTPGPMQIVKNIQIDDVLSKKLLVYVNPVFANAVNVSGVANFSSEQLVIPISGGSNNDIVVIGTIALNARIQNSDLLGTILTLTGGGQGGDIIVQPTRFVLQNGYLSYDNMEMDIGRTPLNFRGRIGLDNSLNMTVVLPVTAVGEMAKIGGDTSGSSRVEVPLKGTLNKPELDTAKLLESQIKQQGGELLRKGLEGLLKK